MFQGNPVEGMPWGEALGGRKASADTCLQKTHGVTGCHHRGQLEAMRSKEEPPYPAPSLNWVREREKQGNTVQPGTYRPFLSEPRLSCHLSPEFLGLTL
jgi:hypothetical protein